jgi:hypothetical protein
MLMTVMIVAMMIPAIIMMAVIQFFIYLHAELSSEGPVTESV